MSIAKAAAAAGQDAGNRSMSKAGRTAWNEDDHNAAAKIAQMILGMYDEEVVADRCIHGLGEGRKEGLRHERLRSARRRFWA